MLPLERQNKILEILAEKQAASVEELCHILYSSGATIRRDLQILENNGLIHRTHGGAIYVDGNAKDFPLTLRESEKQYNTYGTDKPCLWMPAAPSAVWRNA